MNDLLNKTGLQQTCDTAYHGALLNTFGHRHSSLALSFQQFSEPCVGTLSDLIKF
ncbi:hypothetical protein [Sphingomonas sp. PvP056]|uniref:hypothetical protein n=1 Tax=Sphingomonas sp. PvP056 TaxID=3156392 RepID=UPI003399B6EA